MIKKTIFLLSFTICISSSTLTSSWLFCCCKPKDKASKESDLSSSILSKRPTPDTIHGLSKTIPYQNLSKNSLDQEDAPLTIVHKRLYNPLLVKVSIVSALDEIPKLDSKSRACASTTLQESQTISSAQRVSLYENKGPANLIEYKEMKDSIAADFQKIRRKFRPINLNSDDDDTHNADESFSQIDEFSSDAKRDPETRYNKHKMYAQALQRHLPSVHQRFKRLIETTNPATCTKEDEKTTFDEIQEFVNSCDTDHRYPISLWLTTYFNDEMREKRIVMDYVHAHIKKVFRKISDRKDYFQLNRLNLNKKLFSRGLAIRNSDDAEDHVRKREINDYLDDHPSFIDTIEHEFSSLFILQCQDTL